MKILPTLLPRFFAVLLCFTLSSCLSHNNKQLHNMPSGSVESEAAATDNQDEEISSVEPEETAEEELEALNAPGAWEYGIAKTYSLEKLGIDPAKYDFPIMVNKQVLYYLELFQGKQRNYFSQWLARSSMYRPFIEAELKKAGLPQDLVFLAMIESGYNPSAYSPAKACGLWQFIASTGSRYGLRIDSWVDERRQPEKATKAAIQYLATLHTMFDDWYLAVAAYNAGEKKIDTALKTMNAKDFWEIAASEGIFMETKRYVPKLIAAIIIARNPEQYGFTDIAYKKPQEYETIAVPSGINLEAVAAAANASTKELRSLNNELIKGKIPPSGKYTLRIPLGTKDLVAANLNKLRPVTTIAYATHTVKKGENLDSICNLYNINKTTILKANNLRTAQLSKGMRLQIPSPTVKYVLAKDSPGKRAVANNGTDKHHSIVKHTVQPAETVYSIAKRYRVSPQQIQQWNALSQPNKMKQGQQLVLYLSLPQPVLAEKPASTPPGKIVVADGMKKHKPSVAVPVLESGKKRSVAKAQANERKATMQAPMVVQAVTKQPSTWYIVQRGDTLVTIAKKFQSSPQNIRDWNNLSGSMLQTGDKLIVKKG
jgi:Soluble lytic murein transglycosylase and related regulatory proteins (some contain LysM/invasin domains)